MNTTKQEAPGHPSLARHRGRWIAVGSVVAAALLVFGFLLVPESHSYSGSFSTSYLHLGSYDIDPPTGAEVQGAWNLSGTGNVVFMIVDGTDYPIYASNGTHGTFGFPATAPPYSFVGLLTVNHSSPAETVGVSGTFDAPLL